ncbi:hypothetical protein M413DRAFT_445034 [Hebeloma cylindrosporum]|uniref:Alpha/beta hydrolase fold-3 domain-containing protein n=1 Tax=Hebeloma cylindrosporum TaxID=76867 RepID=A0A0C3CC49_HEBCY|nr:hypothetical protein M413DRAFT_445034 [Hebeloma cylindrosporum h7]
MANAASAELPRNKLTFLDKLKIAFNILPLPVVVIWALLKSPFTTRGRSLGWRRIAHDSAVRRIVKTLNRRQMRALVPTTLAGYLAFMKQENMEPLVEELGEDARLLWISPRETDRVLLYFHGGAFLFSTGPSAPAFWSFIQKNLKSRGHMVDAVMLNYTLVPDAMFPVQLMQAVLSIQRLLTLGYEPKNIHLVGDSAGGALLHQLISHILHPVERIPKLTLTSPLGSVYMMSPWTRMAERKGSHLHADEGEGDVIVRSTGTYWGAKVLHGASPSAIPYLEAASAPEDWLQGIDKCVKRVLITAGELEILCDDILDYGKHVARYLKDTTVIVQENAIHEDPLLDFFVGEKELGSLTPKILDWLEEGISR